MSAPEPLPRAASSVPRWYAVERPCRPAPTIRYFVRAGSTMSSLLPYGQRSFRDRHSLALALQREEVSGSGQAIAAHGSRSAVGVERALLDGDGDGLLEQSGAGGGQAR